MILLVTHDCDSGLWLDHARFVTAWLSSAFVSPTNLFYSQLVLLPPACLVAHERKSLVSGRLFQSILNHECSKTHTVLLLPAVGTDPLHRLCQHHLASFNCLTLSQIISAFCPPSKESLPLIPRVTRLSLFSFCHPSPCHSTPTSTSFHTGGISQINHWLTVVVRLDSPLPRVISPTFVS